MTNDSDTKPLSRTIHNMLTGTVSIFVAQLIVIPTGFITSVFLARQLGPMDFGLFALSSRLIVWVEWTGTSMLSGATAKFVSQEKDWQAVGSLAVQMYLIMSLCSAGLIWLLAPHLARLFDEPAIAEHIRLFTMEIPLFSLLAAYRNILSGRGFFKERARLIECYWITRLILIVLLVQTGFSVKGAIIGSIGGTAAGLLLGMTYIRVPLFRKSEFSVRRLWNFAAPLFLSSLGQRIFRLDLFALKSLGGTAAQAGFYSAALNLSLPPSLISQSLAPPLLSTLSRLFSENEEAEAKEIGKTIIRSDFWLIPFAVMTAGASAEIVEFVFGTEFLSAGPILSLLIFAATGLFVIKNSNAILTALDKPGWTFMVTGPMVPLALIGHLILIPRMGATGAALVTTLVSCFGALASLFAVYRIWRIYPPLKTVLKSAVCSLLAFALASLWPAFGWMLILKLVVIVLVILLTFFLLGEFTARELNWLRSLRRKRET